MYMPNYSVILCTCVISRNNQAILGENNQNLPRIVAVIADAFNRESVSGKDDVSKRMLNIVRQVQVST